MTTKRQTIKVDDLRSRVNSMLAAPGNDHQGRIALCVLIESVLQDTGNYRGFQFVGPLGVDRLTPEMFGPDDPRHSRRRYY